MNGPEQANSIICTSRLPAGEDITRSPDTHASRILIFALFMRHQSSWMGTGWATGICLLVLLAALPRQLGAGDGSVKQLHVVHYRQRTSRFIQ